MTTPRTFAVCTFTLLLFGAALGCRTENVPSRAELAQQRKVQAGETILPVPQYASDDAALVRAACGQPSYDAVLPIYNKLENGPVRRMVYTGKRTVTLEFVPSNPPAEQASTPAPFPHPRQLPPQAALPANSVWRFDDAHMEQEEMLTSRRLAVYLPCAGRALGREF